MRNGREFPPHGLSPAGIGSQLAPLLVAVMLTAAVTAGAITVSIASDGIQMIDLLSDPAELTGIPWYLGAVSNINLLIWAAGAALYLVAGIGLRPRNRRLGTALAAIGVLTIVLALDDLLLLHEIVIPWVVGLPQNATFAAYAGVFAVIVVRYRHEILALPEVSVFAVAALALAASVALDVLGWDTDARRVAEEVCKLLGVTAWSVFPAAVTIRRLATSAPPDKPARDMQPRRHDP